jgi:hypothetical protein
MSIEQRYDIDYAITISHQNVVKLWLGRIIRCVGSCVNAEQEQSEQGYADMGFLVLDKIGMN